MAKSRNKFKEPIIIKLDKNEVTRGAKGLRREEEIEAGNRVPTHQVHKDRTTFTRKKKHKKRYDGD